MLHFTAASDALDGRAYDKTGSALKYVLSLRKVAARDVFCCKEDDIGGLFVSERARPLDPRGLHWSRI
jgi:hypothetical protein